MVRFFVILIVLALQVFIEEAPASAPMAPWPEELKALKAQVAEGSERTQVAARLAELYQNYTDEKTKDQVLVWSPQLLEIFQTQSALNDFERARSLAEKEPVLALELLHRALTTEPGHPKVLQEIIQLHLQFKDQGKARPLVQKMSEDYPLLPQTHILQLRLFSAEHSLEPMKKLAEQNLPFQEIQELSKLVYAAHRSMEDPAASLPQLSKESLARFESWPEIYYLAAKVSEPGETKWAAEFLNQCGYGATAAATPKYPTAICQKVPEMKELANSQLGSEK